MVLRAVFACLAQRFVLPLGPNSGVSPESRVVGAGEPLQRCDALLGLLAQGRNLTARLLSEPVLPGSLGGRCGDATGGRCGLGGPLTHPNPARKALARST
jgi:hypothetical protein